MTMKKWRIAQAVERGAHDEAMKLAQAAGLQEYARGLIDVDRRLRLQVGGVGGVRLGASVNLSSRIMDSIREAETLGAEDLSGLGGVGGAGVGRLVRKPVFALACAASLGGIIVAAIYLSGMGGAATGHDGGIAMSDDVEVVASVQEPVRPTKTEWGGFDPSAAILPAGRMVVQRVESPLMQEAELLRRDTQRMTDLVISSLPFGGSYR